MGWDADPVWEGGEGGYRARFRVRPRVIFYRMFWDIFEEFGTCLGDISDDFQFVFGFFSDMFGNAVGTFCGHLRST